MSLEKEVRMPILKDEDFGRVSQLYNNGNTMTQIAKQFGCSVMEVSTFTRHHGLKRVPLAERGIQRQRPSRSKSNPYYVPIDRDLKERLAKERFENETKPRVIAAIREYCNGLQIKDAAKAQGLTRYYLARALAANHLTRAQGKVCEPIAMPDDVVVTFDICIRGRLQ
jgi:hypothetical protein